MFTNKKLREENQRLKLRIADLEERLCPYNEHDWKQIDRRYVTAMCRWDEDLLITYKCKRCGKVIERYDYQTV